MPTLVDSRRAMILFKSIVVFNIVKYSALWFRACQTVDFLKFWPRKYLSKLRVSIQSAEVVHI